MDIAIPHEVHPPLEVKISPTIDHLRQIFDSRGRLGNPHFGVSMAAC